MQLFAHGVKISLFTKIRVINLQLVALAIHNLVQIHERHNLAPNSIRFQKECSVTEYYFFWKYGRRCHMDPNL